ncbi:DUF55-domain-containing protein [Choiromyces venosus 120613-1]|uniref:Thymocyte nuclear protein 1 n=1 Tax=Choiromyces venosus 120613-1 TaxID=1336337 RepID=A0A3N4JKX7_9PEZI|nr:DUF55-domain-containing protein [Choiromyces venosus 120613-1]
MPPKKRARKEVAAAEDSGEEKQQPSSKRTLRTRPAPDVDIAGTATSAVPSKPSQHKKKEAAGNLETPVFKAKKGPGVTVVTASAIDDANDPPSRSYWLMKAEPETRIEKGKDVKFSIDDLRACKKPAGWDGVRNYGARNNLKSMKKGDLAFFYHSNCKEPGIVGIMEIVQEATIDETAFNHEEPYYDPKSLRDNPKWFLVHVEFRRKLERLVGLAELKKYASRELSALPLLKMGRLSVSAVPAECWEFILSLEKMKIEGE